MSREQFKELERKLIYYYGVDFLSTKSDEMLIRKFPKECKKLIILCNKWCDTDGYVNNYGILFLKLLEQLTFKNK